MYQRHIAGRYNNGRREYLETHLESDTTSEPVGEFTAIHDLITLESDLEQGQRILDQLEAQQTRILEADHEYTIMESVGQAKGIGAAIGIRTSELNDLFGGLNYAQESYYKDLQETKDIAMEGIGDFIIGVKDKIVEIVNKIIAWFKDKWNKFKEWLFGKKKDTSKKADEASKALDKVKGDTVTVKAETAKNIANVVNKPSTKGLSKVLKATDNALKNKSLPSLPTSSPSTPSTQSPNSGNKAEIEGYKKQIENLQKELEKARKEQERERNANPLHSKVDAKSNRGTTILVGSDGSPVQSIKKLTKEELARQVADAMGVDKKDIINSDAIANIADDLKDKMERYYGVQGQCTVILTVDSLDEMKFDILAISFYNPNTIAEINAYNDELSLLVSAMREKIELLERKSSLQEELINNVNNIAKNIDKQISSNSSETSEPTDTDIETKDTKPNEKQDAAVTPVTNGGLLLTFEPTKGITNYYGSGSSPSQSRSLISSMGSGVKTNIVAKMDITNVDAAIKALKSKTVKFSLSKNEMKDLLKYTKELSKPDDTDKTPPIDTTPKTKEELEENPERFKSEAALKQTVYKLTKYEHNSTDLVLKSLSNLVDDINNMEVSLNDEGKINYVSKEFSDKLDEIIDSNNPDRLILPEDLKKTKRKDIMLEIEEGYWRAMN